MASTPRNHRATLSRAQICLFVVIALLAVTVEVLILRDYFETSRTSAFFKGASTFTTAMANMQRETLLLQVETSRLLSGREEGFAHVDLRRGMLANRLVRQEAQAQAMGNDNVIAALSEIHATLHRYDTLLDRVRQTPRADWGQYASPIYTTLGSLEDQVTTLYDEEEVAFFEATGLALRAQRTSGIISLSVAGVILFLVVVLGFSLRRSVGILRSEMAERARAEAENRQMAESLERRVVERTTELTATLEQLEKVSRHKSEFLANMSHELRTPLNAIIGYSEMLREQAEDGDQEDFIPDLQRVHTAGKHLLDLVNEVLDFSRIEAGKPDLDLQRFSIPEMVEEVAAIVRPLAENNGNVLKVQLDRDVDYMEADITKVRQTLFNLLSNSCKFTEDGMILLSASRVHHHGKEWITFAVTDTGIGISPEQMARLFHPFSQADASTTRRYGGTGLGLALSRSFCQVMGGDISVESEPGAGSTFVATIPATVVEPTVDPKTAGTRVASPLQENGQVWGSPPGRETYPATRPSGV